MAPSTWAQWVGAIATSAAVIVALFKEEVLRRLRRPKLTVRIKPSGPDCVKVPYNVYRANGDLRNCEAYWLRLWVENCGNARAKKVQVFLSRVRKSRADGSFEPMNGFAPMNLRWSNSDLGRPEIFADGISPEMGKHCDLACVVEPEDSTDRQAALELWVEAFPANHSHRLAPGEYELEIKTAGSNCMPVTNHISLNWTGSWLGDERKMFSDGVRITLT